MSTFNSLGVGSGVCPDDSATTTDTQGLKEVLGRLDTTRLS